MTVTLEDLKGILAIGGIPVVVLLAFFLLLKASRPLEQRPLGPGLVFTLLGLSLAALAGQFLLPGSESPKANGLLLFAALLAGIGADAARGLKPRLRTVAMSLGALLQLAAFAGWTIVLFGLGGDASPAGIWRVGSFVVLWLFSAAVLLRQILAPDWNAGWLTRTLSLLMLVACMFAANWLMAVAWAVLLGGPLLAAYLDRKSKTSNSAPPAMEPTA